MIAANRVLGVALAAMFLVGPAACDKKEGLRITGIEPKSGPYTGGTVTITGSGFQEGAAKDVTVYFGSNPATVLGWIGDSTLKVTAPAVSEDQIGKPVDIQFVFGDARGLTIEKAYTYEEVNKGFGVDALVEGDEAVEGGGTTPPTTPEPDQPAPQ